MSSTPIAVLLRSPPDIVFFSTDPTIVLAQSYSPSSSIKELILISYFSSLFHCTYHFILEYLFYGHIRANKEELGKR